MNENRTIQVMQDQVSAAARVASTATYRLPSGLHVIVDPERPFCRNCGDRLEFNRNCRNCGERG